jgi:hypothetical protein
MDSYAFSTDLSQFEERVNELIPRANRITRPENRIGKYYMLRNKSNPNQIEFGGVGDKSTTDRAVFTLDTTTGKVSVNLIGHGDKGGNAWYGIAKQRDNSRTCGTLGKQGKVGMLEYLENCYVDHAPFPPPSPLQRVEHFPMDGQYISLIDKEYNIAVKLLEENIRINKQLETMIEDLKNMRATSLEA